MAIREATTSVQRETAEWVLELQSNLLRLETSTGGCWSSTGAARPGREGDGSRAPGEGSPAQPATPAGR